MLTTAEIASAFSVGVHGTTFGGNPLACAVAGAVFDIVNTTEVLDACARATPCSWGNCTISERREVFADIRGEGVWLGCELKAPAGQGSGRDEGVQRRGADCAHGGSRRHPHRTVADHQPRRDPQGLARLEIALGKSLA
jgi:acetylornithine/succinyldiaminopimelate/putrescine aminotransferase